MRSRVVGCQVWVLALLGLLLLVLSPAVAAEPRVVAVADVHGEFDGFTAILRQSELVDGRLRWTGGDTILVQLGDVPDRGPKSRAVFDLLMALEKQAAKKKGRVVPLLGNHEVMNLTGDLRYVSPAEYASFAEARSERRQRDAYQRYVRWLKQRSPGKAPVSETEWRQAHPEGFLEHRQAFSPSGKYGRWLRPHDTIARVGDTLFVHGGLSPDLPGTVESINRQVRDEIQAFDQHKAYMESRGIILPFFTLQEMTEAARDELQRIAAGTSPEGEEGKRRLEAFLTHPTWFSFHPGGPFWFRGYDTWTDEEGVAKIGALLERYRAKRIVAGHSAQEDGRARARFGGRLFLIDTGMLSSHYPGGRASALEIRDGTFAAIYPGERVVLFPGPAVPGASHALLPERWGGGAPEAPAAARMPLEVKRTWIGPDGKPLPFQNDQEVLDFLATARVLSMKYTAEGVTAPRKVLLEKNGIRAHAVFRDVDEDKPVVQMARGGVELGFRDSYIFEPAAYHLSLLLGAYNVPPAIERRIDGKNGSIQIWIEGAVTEGKRRKDNLTASDPVKYNQQLHNMNVLDNLIFNADRNAGNILIMPDSTVWLIDHTRAFRRKHDLKAPQMILQCERRFFEAIQTLNEAEVRARLKPYLRPAEIDAIFKRRPKVLQYIQGLIAAQGEKKVLFDVAAPAADKP